MHLFFNLNKKFILIYTFIMHIYICKYVCMYLFYFTVVRSLFQLYILEYCGYICALTAQYAFISQTRHFLFYFLCAFIYLFFFFFLSFFSFFFFSFLLQRHLWMHLRVFCEASTRKKARCLRAPQSNRPPSSPKCPRPQQRLARVRHMQGCLTRVHVRLLLCDISMRVCVCVQDACGSRA